MQICMDLEDKQNKIDILSKINSPVMELKSDICYTIYDKRITDIFSMTGVFFLLNKFSIAGYFINIVYLVFLTVNREEHDDL